MPYQCYDGAETAGTVFLAFHLGKEATDVGGGVVAVAISVHGAETGGVYSRCAIQRIDMKAGVVGKAVHTVFLCHIACLLQGIAL